MRKILVANRGEIALRIMKTIRTMGLKSIAVYSEADRNSPHVLFADEAYDIGPAPSLKSYLNQNTILKIARTASADAIHPGYGFLSESASFTQRVEDCGLIFIGPSPGSMKIMGNKLSAKAAVSNYQIPQLPSTDKPVEDKDLALDFCREIGFPVMLKAAAGGGGKGMRIVNNEKEFHDHLQRAKSEAMSSFGDDSVFIEKYIPSPRHIEFQIFGDQHGNYVHMFERECSIQRRHQKIIEEAPSSFMTKQLRERMGKAAIDVARACKYTGAGTVEFLLDRKRNFYFLEMNTRLQVEHPVTEMITGLDLVKLQIQVARDEPLNICQEEITINGHAIELRVYAEDSFQNFTPNIGKLEYYKKPTDTPGKIRIDDGYEKGMEIPIYYDPLISKLICHGDTRELAIQQMIDAISEYSITGVETTLPFGYYVMQHDSFISGNYNTHFVGNHFSNEKKEAWLSERRNVAAAAALNYYLNNSSKLRLSKNSDGGWRKRKEYR